MLLVKTMEALTALHYSVPECVARLWKIIP
jgi:hypothetical protein